MDTNNQCGSEDYIYYSGLGVFLKNAKWVYHNEDVKQKFLLFDMLFSHIWAWLALITFFQYIIVTIGTQTFRCQA